MHNMFAKKNGWLLQPFIQPCSRVLRQTKRHGKRNLSQVCIAAINCKPEMLFPFIFASATPEGIHFLAYIEKISIIYRGLQYTKSRKKCLLSGVVI